jgi:2-succinyl-6-hydroxy-2,4-cyclohexadiene-1-carboxylate synthase
MPQILLAPYAIHYELRGDSSQPKLLFLHGFMGCGGDFDGIIDALLPEFCCLTVDLPGHGQTQVLDAVGYDMDILAPVLLKLLHRLNFDPCHLVGYSMGGRLALYLSYLFPQQFLSVLLVSASPGLNTITERVLRQHQDAVLAAALESEDWPTVLMRWYEQPLFASFRASQSFNAIFQRRLQNGSHQLAQALRGLGTGAQLSLWPILPSLKLPMMLVVGALDLKFVQINQRMAAQMPFAQLKIIPACGHVVHAENSAAFMAALQTHLLKG